MNGLLTRTELVLDPPEFTDGEYLDSDQNFFQIHVRGRVLLLAFGPSEHSVSTENFREPYTLEGTVRCFNQDLLEHNSIEEQLIFYCRSVKECGWRYSNPRTHQAGDLDEEYLVTLFSLLV